MASRGGIMQVALLALLLIGLAASPAAAARNSSTALDSSQVDGVVSDLINGGDPHAGKQVLMTDNANQVQEYKPGPAAVRTAMKIEQDVKRRMRDTDLQAQEESDKYADEERVKGKHANWDAEEREKKADQLQRNMKHRSERYREWSQEHEKKSAREFEYKRRVAERAAKEQREKIKKDEETAKGQARTQAQEEQQKASADAQKEMEESKKKQQEEAKKQQDQLDDLKNEQKVKSEKAQKEIAELTQKAEDEKKRVTEEKQRKRQEEQQRKKDAANADKKEEEEAKQAQKAASDKHKEIEEWNRKQQERQQPLRWCGCIAHRQYFDRDYQNWRQCPAGYLMTGLYRGDTDFLNGIYYLHCCKPCEATGDVREVNSCYAHNWWSSFDSQGWSTCNDNYYMAGIWHNACNWIYCIEYALCCRIKDSNAVVGCGTANWVGSLDGAGWSVTETNTFLRGLYRTSDHYLHNIEYGYQCTARSY